jgi:hypothetical protein
MNQRGLKALSNGLPTNLSQSRVLKQGEVTAATSRNLNELVTKTHHPPGLSYYIGKSVYRSSFVVCIVQWGNTPEIYLAEVMDILTGEKTSSSLTSVGKKHFRRLWSSEIDSVNCMRPRWFIPKDEVEDGGTEFIVWDKQEWGKQPVGCIYVVISPACFKIERVKEHSIMLLPEYKEEWDSLVDKIIEESGTDSWGNGRFQPARAKGEEDDEDESSSSSSDDD